jgi:membrane-bound lytic murein transglycosylase D
MRDLGSILWWLRQRKALVHAIALCLLMTATAWAQVTNPSWSATSVDESFSAFHQALSATANDLLAGAQRPSAMSQPDPSLPAVLRLGLEFHSLNARPTEGETQLRHALGRVETLRPALEPILRQEGIPPQLTAVVLVESGGQLNALSPKGARGLWQIMPETARRYGLVVNRSLDERLDLDKSTRAAARYLRDLYTQFGNWPLALAAYNSGEETVQRAIDRASTRDFDSIARAGMLPLETRNYVPAVLSAISLIRNAGGKSVTTGAGQSAQTGVVYAVDTIAKEEGYEELEEEFVFDP